MIYTYVEIQKQYPDNLTSLWEECGGDNLINIQYAYYSPDPVQIPGSVSFNFGAQIHSQFDGPLPVSLIFDLKKN